jgi:hypothetical protein
MEGDKCRVAMAVTSTCRIQTSIINAVLRRHLLRHPYVSGSLTTRPFLLFEFNITPLLISHQEASRMVGITTFKIFCFLFTVVFPSNRVWPMSTNKKPLSLTMFIATIARHLEGRSKPTDQECCAVYSIRRNNNFTFIIY